jgi:hypothetical protein
MNRYGQASKSIEAVLFGSVLGVKVADIIAVSLVAIFALAVIVVLLLGAGLNVKGENSAARKGGGGNAKGGELKAKLAANEVLQRNNAAGAKCLYACACLRMWARVRYVRARG